MLLAVKTRLAFDVTQSSLTDSETSFRELIMNQHKMYMSNVNPQTGGIPGVSLGDPPI